MEYETKKITDAWEERCVGDDELSELDSRLWEIRKTWEKCRDLLAEEGRTLYYEISQDRIDSLMEQMQAVADYAQEIDGHFSSYQDEPFYKAFVNGATEYLSRIKLEDFKTSDTVRRSVDDTGSGLDVQFDAGLGFSDFLGEWAVEEIEAAGAVGAEDVLVAGGAAFLGTELKEEPLLAGVDADAGMVRFAEYFGKQYYELEKAGAFEEGEIEDFSDYLDALEMQGEFEHSMDKPVLEFLNGVLDLLILPPLIEAVTGEEFLTGEDLNGYQRGMKVLSAVLDVMSIGQASMALGITKMGTSQALVTMGKVATVEIGSNLAAYGVVSLGENLDLPVPFTLLLGLGVGAGVNHGLGKVVYANPNGMRARRIARETPDPEIPVLRNTDEVADAGRGVSEGGTGERLIPGTEGVVTGGDSTKLGKNMMESMGLPRGTNWTGHQAQHIISAEMANHPVLQRIGMDLDDASNGLFLRTPADDISVMSRHRGYHSTYNEFVRTNLME